MSLPEEVLDEHYANPYEQGRLRVLSGLIPKGYGNAALDLGCGSGYISAMLSAAGWRVTAVDLHPENVERAAAKVERAIAGDAVEVARSLPDGGYRFICTVELIEHLDDAGQAELLRQLRRLAAPNARLLLSTPNKMSPDGLYGYYYAELVRGKKYKAWDPTHQSIYTSFGIVSALRRSGWKPLKVVGYYYRGKFSLPLQTSDRFPLNYLGFNTIVLCDAA
jgi:2-polyprenyl-3-methyl-5-hydroxy-6-metoxy-1,4-benzoquinol methylase